MFAARLMDMHVCPQQTPAVVPIPHVGGPITMPIMGKPCLIGGMPAAGAGSMCVCIGPPDAISPACASNKVLVNGTPLAKMGDATIHGGSIILGCFTVLIGAGGMNPSAIADMASSAMEAAASVAAEAENVMNEISTANDRINELQELADAGDLSEAQQTEMDELNEQYDQTIDDMGMNDDDFEDWT